MARLRPPRLGQTNNNKKKPSLAAPAPPARPANTPATRPGTAAARRPTPASRKNTQPPKKSLAPMLLVGGVLLVMAIAVALVMMLSGSNNDNTATSSSTNTTPQGIEIEADPDAKVQTFPSQGNNHIVVGANHVVYNSDPPISGPHYPQPVPWGIYDKPVADEYLVHNLEHGGIVIQYVCNGDCTTAINQLSVYARRYPRDAFTGILLAPRPSLPGDAKIAVTAWQNLLLMKSLDTKKLDTFIATYFNKGPESAS